MRHLLGSGALCAAVILAVVDCTVHEHYDDDDDGDGGTSAPGTGMGGAGHGGGGGAADPVTVTIPEIQQGTVPTKTRVRLESVVVTTPVTEPHSSCEVRAFWVQDPNGGEHSGIAVKIWENVMPGFQVTAGTMVNLEGLYDEYFDVSNIVLQSAADLTVLSGTTAVTPKPVADACAVTLWEPYEGVLLELENLTVSKTIHQVGYGQFEVNGCLLVDSLFFEYTACGGTEDRTPDPPLGQPITSITGALHYTFGEFKLEPTGPGAFRGWSP